MSECRYPLAREGVFWTIQGEGSLLGLPMVFVRLAGCSVGCPECDTDYAVASRATAGEIARQVAEATTPSTGWVWLTGGEPTDHDLLPLLEALRRAGFLIALATAGTRAVPWNVGGAVDFLSVSPHSLEGWVQREGNALNLVPGLNGLVLNDAWKEALDQCEHHFTARYVTPLWGDESSRAQCLEWVRRRPGWRLGVQAHKYLGMP